MQWREFTTTGPRSMFQEVEVTARSTGPDLAHAPRASIAVETSREFQEIDGFGASFTDSSAYLMAEVLSTSDRERAMRELFSPTEGIGLSLIRNPMGASDYARTIYSYDDLPEGESDPELEHFSIEHDRASILPLTRRAKELNPLVQVFASPWSAPGWMKTSGKMVTGKLKHEWARAYAQYFVRYIQACAAEGVEIAAVSPQNEPLFVPLTYPGMEMLASEQVAFVRDYLAPALRRAGLSTKIMGYDHNWDRVDYAFDLLDSAADSFDGIAWHWYGGRAVSQSRVSRDYPDKEVHFFEGSGGSWIPEYLPAFTNLLRTGIDILRNGSRSFILWNIALDENNGPTVPGFGTSTCRGLLRVNQEEASYERTIDYWGLAHFSRFIRPGAVRVASDSTSTIPTLAARNRDGSTVVVVLNDTETDHTIEVSVDARATHVTHLGAGCAATLVLAQHS